MSTALAVAVIVGTVPPGHLTPVKVAVVMPVAAWVSCKTNDLPATPVGIVNVQGVEAVSVAVSTVPAVIDRVADAPTVPLAVMVSVYADTVREPVYEMTPELLIRILSVAPAAMITVSVRAAVPTAPPMKKLLLPAVLKRPAH
jgi:hypothetical protein